MTKTSVSSIFDTMSYPETLTGKEIYENWLSRKPYDACLKVDIEDLKKEARNSIETSAWNDPTSRSTLLLKLSQEVEKQKNLFACVEAGSTKKPLSRTKERDIPELVEHLNTAAQAVANCPNGWMPHGLLRVKVEDTNSPTLAQSLNLGPILAAGNAVVFLVSIQNYHSALLLSDTARTIGFPPSLISVACESSKFSGSFDLTIGSGFQLSETFRPMWKWRPVSRPKSIVTETTDLASAAHGVTQLAFFNAPMSASSGACVLVQESIYDVFWTEIQTVFKSLRPLKSIFSDNGDFYFQLSDTSDSETREKDVKDAISEGAEVVFPVSATANKFDVPLLVRRIKPTSPLLNNQSSTGAQIIWIQSFRHLKEAVTLANGFPFTNHISIWGEQTNVLLDVAKDLRATNIWMNTQNVMDSAGDLDVRSFLSKVEPKKTVKDFPVGYGLQFSSDDFTKDVKKVLSSARVALKKWAGLGAQKQFQLLFSLANELMSNEEALKGVSESSCLSKDIALFRKVTSQTAFSSSQSKETSSVSRTKCWNWRSPLGVVGVVLPSTGTLQSLIFSVGIALAAGNAALMVLDNRPLVDLCEKIFSNSDFPPGMISFLFAEDKFGDSIKVLQEVDIDAVWILTSRRQNDIYPTHNRTETVPILYLDLSGYDWDRDSCHRELGEWFQEQAKSVKNVWFECGGPA